MTKLDLAHLAEVAGKATPGPWVGDRRDGSVKYDLLGRAVEFARGFRTPMDGHGSQYERHPVRQGFSANPYVIKLSWGGFEFRPKRRPKGES